MIGINIFVHWMIILNIYIYVCVCLILWLLNRMLCISTYDSYTYSCTLNVYYLDTLNTGKIIFLFYKYLSLWSYISCSLNPNIDFRADWWDKIEKKKLFTVRRCCIGIYVYIYSMAIVQSWHVLYITYSKSFWFRWWGHRIYWHTDRGAEKMDSQTPHYTRGLYRIIRPCQYVQINCMLLVDPLINL
jgi:hypothetical protein